MTASPRKQVPLAKRLTATLALTGVTRAEFAESIGYKSWTPISLAIHGKRETPKSRKIVVAVEDFLQKETR